MAKNVTTCAQDPDDANKFKINGGDFYCFFEISSSKVPEHQDAPDKAVASGIANKIRLTKSAIINLDIRENFFEPFISGHITINNPFDYIENNHYTTGAGNDFLHVTLCEWCTYKNDPTQALTYTFVITDENNSVSKSDRSNNFKTYALLDVNYNTLNTTNVVGPYPTEQMKDKGEINVSDIIKQVLKDALGPAVINEDLWWPGDHPIGEPDGEFESLVPTIPTALHWKYSDLIKYLLRINYSLGGEGGKLPVQLMLRFNRSDGRYSLEPIDVIFKDNKELTIEAFVLGDLTGNADTRPTAEDQGNKNNPRSGAKINEYDGVLKNVNLTTPMVNYGNEFFVNYDVNTSTTIGGGYNKQIIKIEEVIPKWKKAFVDIFEAIGGPTKPFVPLRHMTSDVLKPMSLPYDKVHAANIGRAQIVSNLTFLNLQLTLDLNGDTFRIPGRFVDIFKLTTGYLDAGGLARRRASEPGSDTKMLGKWLVTKVHHRFFKDSYQNVLQCAKTYIGPDAVVDDPPSPITAKPIEAKVDDTIPTTHIQAPDLGPSEFPDITPALPEGPEGQEASASLLPALRTAQEEEAARAARAALDAAMLADEEGNGENY